MIILIIYKLSAKKTHFLKLSCKITLKNFIVQFLSPIFSEICILASSCHSVVSGLSAENGTAYSKFYRAGVTDRLERLLIGTAYSQYAGRKTALSGTAQLIPSRITMTDASTEGMFLIVHETQNIYEGTSEVKMVEISPDDYSGVEYK